MTSPLARFWIESARGGTVEGCSTHVRVRTPTCEGSQDVPRLMNLQISIIGEYEPQFIAVIPFEIVIPLFLVPELTVLNSL